LILGLIDRVPLVLFIRHTAMYSMSETMAKATSSWLYCLVLQDGSHTSAFGYLITAAYPHVRLIGDVLQKLL
ncbi:hypothetical protein MGSAQ_002948, partial [marine sediment metagenome]